MKKILLIYLLLVIVSTFDTKQPSKKSFFQRMKDAANFFKKEDNIDQLFT